MKRIMAAVLTLTVLIVLIVSLLVRPDASAERQATGFLNNVEYINQNGTEIVDMSIDDYTDYSVKRLHNPERIIIDISNAAAPGKQQYVPADGPAIKSIRYAQFDTYTARVVLEVSGQVEYGVEKTESGLQLYIGDKPEKNDETAEKASFGNLLYYNKGDRVYVTLQGAELTTGDEFLEKLYTEKQDNQGKRYVITFPSSQAELGECKLEINDSYLKSIEVTKNTKAGTTSITFLATKKFSYMVFTRTNPEETAITILSSASKADKLVVIDPGHGGKMPGTIYKGLYEKELNLDIAVRLNKLLKDKKVKTYMLREDDSDVANYERAYIANMLNASLYLSVHNNAMEDDTSINGTMTLYYPVKAGAKGFTAKTFADIVQNKLLSGLGTANRKAVQRTDLIVLRATKMPAVISEIAFITNTKDRNNLQKDTFRQKAAQALCDAVIEALSKI